MDVVGDKPPTTQEVYQVTLGYLERLGGLLLEAKPPHEPCESLLSSRHALSIRE